MANPDHFTDYDDGPPGPVWGYDWRAHVVADAVALALAVGSAAGLAWVVLSGAPAPF
jgi:hypothetical protein